MRKLGVKIKTNNMLCNLTMKLHLTPISGETFSFSPPPLYQSTAPQVLTLRLLPLLQTPYKREFGSHEIAIVYDFISKLPERAKASWFT